MSDAPSTAVPGSFCAPARHGLKLNILDIAFELFLDKKWRNMTPLKRYSLKNDEFLPEVLLEDGKLILD